MFDTLESAVIGGAVNGRAGLVQITRPDGKGCTGTMISANTILTAAHCVKDVVGDVSVAYFRPGLPAGSPEQLGSISASWIPHGSYPGEGDSSANDMGLVVSSNPWPRTDYHDYVRVNTSGSAQSDYVLFGAGFGGGIGVLRTATLSRSSTFPTRFVLDIPNTKGVCSGDSGGPYMLPNKTLDQIACIHSHTDRFKDEECASGDEVLDDAYCARPRSSNATFITNNVSGCKSFTDSDSQTYVRCFELPFVSDVSDGDRLPKGVAVAIVGTTMAT